MPRANKRDTPINALLVTVFTILISGCAEKSRAECAKEPLENLLGTYDVTEASRYRGGLTTKETARERVGSQVSIDENHMISDFASIEQPQYQIECYSAVDNKGEVTDRRFSNFYGIGVERDSVKVLEVYAEGDPKGEPSYYFEIVNNELWELYDGWLYTLTKPTEPQDCPPHRRAPMRCQISGARHPCGAE